jgi:hypothetical protein
VQGQCTYFNTEHLRKLIGWAKEKPLHKNALFLVESLAPLVLGIKPSELLNVSLKNDEWRNFKTVLTQKENLQLEEIRELNGRLQVIFYRKEILDSVLKQKQIYDFLVSMDYPKKYSVEVYLRILKQKLMMSQFPHEIGIFLGYPLKDVLGFMGILPLPYRRTQGWRIYGEEMPSDELYIKYSEARHIMRKIALEG